MVAGIGLYPSYLHLVLIQWVGLLLPMLIFFIFWRLLFELARPSGAKFAYNTYNPATE